MVYAIYPVRCTLIQLCLGPDQVRPKASYPSPSREKVSCSNRFTFIFSSSSCLRAFVRKRFSHKSTKITAWQLIASLVPAFAEMTRTWSRKQHGTKTMIRSMTCFRLSIAFERQLMTAAKGHTLPGPKTAQSRLIFALVRKATQIKTLPSCKPPMKFSHRAVRAID